MLPVIIFLILIIIWIVLIYNSFIALINRTSEAWSDIDVLLKRKYDLIPKLIAAVKGYKKYEADLLVQLTALRTTALQAKTASDKERAYQKIEPFLAKFLAVAENYPDLKASQNFLDLQKQLTETEDTLSNARRFYNGCIRNLNIKLETFPNNFLAKVLNFQKKEFFQLEEDEKENS